MSKPKKFFTFPFIRSTALGLVVVLSACDLYAQTLILPFGSRNRQPEPAYETTPLPYRKNYFMLPLTTEAGRQTANGTVITTYKPIQITPNRRMVIPLGPGTTQPSPVPVTPRGFNPVVPARSATTVTYGQPQNYGQRVYTVPSNVPRSGGYSTQGSQFQSGNIGSPTYPGYSNRRQSVPEQNLDGKSLSGTIMPSPAPQPTTAAEPTFAPEAETVPSIMTLDETQPSAPETGAGTGTGTGAEAFPTRSPQLSAPKSDTTPLPAPSSTPETTPTDHSTRGKTESSSLTVPETPAYRTPDQPIHGSPEVRYKQSDTAVNHSSGNSVTSENQNTSGAIPYNETPYERTLRLRREGHSPIKNDATNELQPPKNKLPRAVPTALPAYDPKDQKDAETEKVWGPTA